MFFTWSLRNMSVFVRWLVAAWQTKPAEHPEACITQHPEAVLTAVLTVPCVHTVHHFGG